MGNLISDNSWWSGGGISLFAAGSPTISGNVIRGNTADQGGGISLANSASGTLIVQNLIVENSANNGGGIYTGVESRRGGEQHHRE